MAIFKGKIVLDKSGDLNKDILVIEGDPDTLSILLTLIDPSLINFPKVTNPRTLAKKIKSGTKKIEIALGDSGIPKEVLLQALKFATIS